MSEQITPEEKASQLEVALQREREEKREKLLEKESEIARLQEELKNKLSEKPAPTEDKTVDVAKQVEELLNKREFENDLAKEVPDVSAREEVRKVFETTFKEVPVDAEARKRLIEVAKTLVTTEQTPAEMTTTIAGGGSRSGKATTDPATDTPVSPKQKAWADALAAKAEVLKKSK